MSELTISTLDVSCGHKVDSLAQHGVRSKVTGGTAWARKMKAKLDLAWAAGMVDGEGSITAVRQIYQPDKNGRPRNPTIRLKLVIVQNDWSTLDRLRKILGCKAHLNEVPWNENHNSRIYQLQYDGANALEAINKLAKYIYRKKTHVHCANKLWAEGQMGVFSKGKRLSPSILAKREKWVARLRKLN